LADQILRAIKTHNRTLAATIERTLDTATRAVLGDLLTQEPLAGDTIPGKTSAYKLTLMKKLSQSTKPSKIKERVADLDLAKGLYHQLNRVLQAIALKPQGIRYYACLRLLSRAGLVRFQLSRDHDAGCSPRQQANARENEGCAAPHHDGRVPSSAVGLKPQLRNTSFQNDEVA
jgi:hypothetical protein